MIINFNNHSEEIAEEVTLYDFLEMKKIRKRTIIWLNGSKINPNSYEKKKLKAGDQIKFVRIIAGG